MAFCPADRDFGFSANGNAVCAPDNPTRWPHAQPPYPASKFLLLPVLLCLGLALLFVLHGVNSRRQQADLDFVRQQA